MRAAAVVIAAWMCSACASSTQDALRQFQESLEAYNDAYRWKNYERAAAFVPADLRAAFLATYEDEENALHVEDYQVLRVDMESENAATAVVRVRYMLLPSVTIEKATLVQHWHRVSGVWVLENEENSIRQLETGKKPRNPDAFGKPDPPGTKRGETKVQVEGPRGEKLRDDGDDEQKPKEQKPEPDEPEPDSERDSDSDGESER